MGNVNMEAKQIHYRGGDKPMSVEEAIKNTAGEAAAIAQLQTDVGNLQSTKANQLTIAPTFNSEDEYEVGNIVYYNGLTYRCVNVHTGEWDASDFIPTTIALELQSHSAIDYSTEEQNTGQKWIDGNDIFVKTIEGTLSSGATTGIQTFNVSTPNIKDILKNEIVVGDTTFVIGGYVPWYSSATVLFGGITDSTLDIYLGGNAYAGKNFKCTVYYTKTTT